MWTACCFPDYNDCQIWGICDQLCEDRAETHICSCADGYFLEQNHICKANVSGKMQKCKSQLWFKGYTKFFFKRVNWGVNAFFNCMCKRYYCISGGLPQLIFTNGGDLMMADIHGRFERTLVPSQGKGNAVGVAYLFKSNIIFWSDTYTEKVGQQFMKRCTFTGQIPLAHSAKNTVVSLLGLLQ